MPCWSSLHQRRVTILVMIFDVGAVIEKGFDCLDMSARTGIHERRVAGGRLRIHVSTVTDEQLNDVNVPCRSSFHERCTIIFLPPIFNLRRHGEKNLSEFIVSGGAGEWQQRVAVVGGIVQAVAFDEQPSDSIHVVVSAGGDEGSWEEATNRILS